ncbi:MAG: hypothetical protein QXH37_02125 [Candidatus Bathyarchaeia archaeon]
MRETLAERFSDEVLVSMFGKFYEKILEQYLESYEKYRALKTDGKATVWFSSGILQKFEKFYLKETISRTNLELFKETVQDIKKRIDNNRTKKAKCHPDGIVQKNNKYYLWEAKCEPRSIVKRAWWWPIKRRIKDFDWFLADEVTVSITGKAQQIPISGYILFWWDKPKVKTERTEHQDIIKKMKVAADILDAQQAKINEFFKELKGTI